MASDRKFIEFGGPLGCAAIYVFTPLLFLSMVYIYQDLDSNFKQFTIEDFTDDLWRSVTNVEIWKFIIIYKIVVALVYMLPALQIVEGPITSNGEKLKYKISAMTSLVIFISIYYYFYKYDPDEDIIEFSLVTTETFSFMVVSTLVAFLWQFAFFIRSYYLENKQRNKLATSGNIIYDSFMGYELHPRIGELFDLKIYLYRYSMLAWVMVALINLGETYKLNEELITTNPEIVIMCLSHLLYCYAVYFGDEASCPHMFDIKHEGLGFSQTFGEIVIVPFIYTFTINLVIDYPDHNNYYDVRIIIATLLLIFGITIGGVSNHQKTKFRTSDWRKLPQDDVITPVTSSQTKLPTSSLYCGGLWKWSRHPNYLGEIMTSLGWSLLCGFTHPFMWFYPLFLIPLVVSRAERLERTSREKDEKTFQKYEDKVAYKIIPFVY